MTDYVWQPRWQYLDGEDLLYVFCEMKLTCSKKQFEDRFFPNTLKRHFKSRGFYYRWEPVISMLDKKDLVYLSQFVKAEVKRLVTIGGTPMSDRIKRHFQFNEDRMVWLWKPDIEWLGLDELPYCVPFWDIPVTEERWKQGTFPDRLRGHFRPAEERSEPAEDWDDGRVEAWR